MNTHPEDSGELLKAAVELQIAGRKLQLEAPIPAGPTQLSDLLPFLRYVTDRFVDASVEKAQEEGLTVSCQKGCGACCRQLVPISAIEAQRLKALVEQMPEPRKSTLLARFEAARQQLQATGLLEKLREPRRINDEDVDPVGLTYFQQRIACPFLEEESCSIYEERPLACREYLVVNPPEDCAQPTVDSIKPVPILVRVAKTVRMLNVEKAPSTPPWVALILILEQADADPDEMSPQPGPELVREIINLLSGRDAENG